MSILFTGKDQFTRDYQGAYIYRFSVADVSGKTDEEVIAEFTKNEALFAAAWPAVKSADTKELLSPAFRYAAITSKDFKTYSKNDLAAFFDFFIKDQLWFGDEEETMKTVWKWLKSKMADCVAETCYLLNMEALLNNKEILNAPHAEQYDYFFTIFLIDRTAMSLSVCHMFYE